jgi:hypothetical protein
MIAAWICESAELFLIVARLASSRSCSVRNCAVEVA